MAEEEVKGSCKKSSIVKLSPLCLCVFVQPCVPRESFSFPLFPSSLVVVVGGYGTAGGEVRKKSPRQV